MDNLEKLKEKVGKDPTSKLFVPLAEEYKKAGMLDKAIATLTAGLLLQPGYMSARVALGKIYLEKGIREAARDEFEKVIRTIPDNLFAQRKLAEIYMDMGDNENALERYKAVLKLNPRDEEVLSIVKELDKTVITPEKLEIGIPALPSLEPAAFGEIILEETKAEEEAFQILPEEFPFEEVEMPPSEEPTLEMPETEPLSIEEAEKLLREVSLPEEVLQEEVSIPEELLAEVPILEEVLQEEVSIPEELLAEVPILEEILQEEVSIPEELLASATLPEETDEFARLHEEAIFLEAEHEELLSETVEPKPQPTLSLADSFVSQGNYYEAMRTYKALLKDNPENKQVMQRTYELKALLKLLGKDKEVLIARLETFLNTIKKRGSELFGSS